MTDPSRIRRLLEEANPVPDPTAAHDNGSAADVLLSAINERRGVMHTTPTRKPLKPVPPPKQPWYRKPAAVFAAAVAVAILAAIPLFLFASTGGDMGEGAVVTTAAPTVATTAPEAAPTVPPTTTPPPPVTTAAPARGAYERVGTGVTDSVVGIFDMTGYESGLVAAGSNPGDDNRQDGVILESDDGVVWTRLAADDPALTTGTVLIYGITEGGSGLVAGGMSCDDDLLPCDLGPYPTVWTSDDGTSWTRTVIEPGLLGAIEDVVATDLGIVAAGWVNRPIDGSDDPTVVSTSPVVWLRPPGSDWVRVWEGDPVSTEGFPPGVNRILALAVGPDGLIVGAGSAQNDDGVEVAAVWTSQDARVWDRVPPDSAVFGSAMGGDVSMIDVASGPAGFVAVGNEAAAEIAVWQSPDGRSWSRIETANQPDATTGVLSAVTPLQSGWAAAGFGPGFGEGPVTIWTSPDGATWTRTAELDNGYAQAIATINTDIAVAGGMVEADDFHAAIWTGSATPQD